MLKEASYSEIYIACGYTDLRKGIDGLAAWIQQQFDLNPHRTGAIFLFCGRIEAAHFKSTYKCDERYSEYVRRYLEEQKCDYDLGWLSDMSERYVFDTASGTQQATRNILLAAGGGIHAGCLPTGEGEAKISSWRSLEHLAVSRLCEAVSACRIINAVRWLVAALLSSAREIAWLRVCGALARALRASGIPVTFYKH